MKKRFAIFAFFVLLLLVASQLVWVSQVLERDKKRFQEQLFTSIMDLVMFQTGKQTFELFAMNPQTPSLTIERLEPDSVPKNAKVYGSYEGRNYEQTKSISKFFEAAMTEMLLEKDTLNLSIIDSLFRNNFDYSSEISAYMLEVQRDKETINSLSFGKNAIKQLNDTTKGVLIAIPLGTSGAYRFVSHFVFKPSTITRRLVGLAAMSGVAIIAVAIIVFLLLSQLQRQMLRLQSQEKRVRGIVHDLKSPLSYIFSMLGFFELNEKNEQRNMLILEGKSRLKGLSDRIERMLSEVKLNENNKVNLQRDDYDIEVNCRKIISDLQLIYKEKNIAVTFAIESDAKCVCVDAFYFDNCLRNLLDNAVKYSDDTPVITIEVQKEKKHTAIHIGDNGMGIPQKDQHLVFTSFFRSSAHPTIKGHGIGLSSVQQTVKAHGGKIKVKSKEGRGSVFTIILPNKQ